MGIENFRKCFENFGKCSEIHSTIHTYIHTYIKMQCSTTQYNTIQNDMIRYYLMFIYDILYCIVMSCKVMFIVG